MSKKSIAVVAGASLATLALVASLAIADTTSSTGNSAAQTSASAVKKMVSINASGHATLSGAVAGISGSSLTVNSWGGVWTVNTGSAKLIRRFGGASSLSEFQNGDYVLVTGSINQSSPWTIDATVVRDMSIQVRNAAFSGTISNLNGSSFTFATKERGSVNVTVNSDATIKVNGKAGAVSDLQNGMTGSVSGVWDRSQSTVLASRVVVRMPKATSH